MEIPKWRDMPESKPLVTLSWEDIYDKAQLITQEKFSRKPTRHEIKELFDIILHKGMDMEEGVFWSTIEHYSQKYYEEKESIANKSVTNKSRAELSENKDNVI